MRCEVWFRKRQSWGETRAISLRLCLLWSHGPYSVCPHFAECDMHALVGPSTNFRWFFFWYFGYLYPNILWKDIFNNFIYLFIFDCAGSLLYGLFSSCDIRISFCCDFSYCGTQAIGHVGFGSCGTWAQLLCGMWDPPRPGIEPMSPALMGFSGGSAGKESACNVGDLGLIPGLGRSPEEGNSYPLQYSGLENSVDSMFHGVAKSQTWLND